MGAKADIRLGKLAGLDIGAELSAIIGSLLLWVALSTVALFLLNRSFPVALVAGLIAVLMHWVAVICHQLGHAWAARRSGHPMVGVNLWGVLSSSIYPPDEPPLPKPIHIQRALGGPMASLALSVVSVVPLLLLQTGTTAWWLALFFLADNLLVFAIGSLLPLGFTDGSTLLHWLKASK